MHTGFWWGNLRERAYLEALEVDGMVILMWIFNKRDAGIEWIDVAECRDRW